MQLGMMVHLRPSLSAAIDAGSTTMRLTTAMAENMVPMTSSFKTSELDNRLLQQPQLCNACACVNYCSFNTNKEWIAGQAVSGIEQQVGHS